MPLGDRTGPRGEGPLTGRGLGPCGTGTAAGYAKGFGRGVGRGFGAGAVRGRRFTDTSKVITEEEME